MERTQNKTRRGADVKLMRNVRSRTRGSVREGEQREELARNQPLDPPKMYNLEPDATMPMRYRAGGLPLSLGNDRSFQAGVLSAAQLS